jgi:hypothetical protein
MCYSHTGYSSIMAFVLTTNSSTFRRKSFALKQSRCAYSSAGIAASYFADKNCQAVSKKVLKFTKYILNEIVI